MKTYVIKWHYPNSEIMNTTISDADSANEACRNVEKMHQAEGKIEICHLFEQGDYIGK